MDLDGALGTVGCVMAAGKSSSRWNPKALLIWVASSLDLKVPEMWKHFVINDSFPS